MEPGPTHLSQRLEEALRALAASADDQITMLEAEGLHVDELALGLGDCYSAWLAQSSPVAGPAQLDLLQELSARLDEMSGRANASLWTFDALRKASQWSEVRHLAAQALRKKTTADDRHGRSKDNPHA